MLATTTAVMQCCMLREAWHFQHVHENPSLCQWAPLLLEMPCSREHTHTILLDKQTRTVYHSDSQPSKLLTPLTKSHFSFLHFYSTLLQCDLLQTRRKGDLGFDFDSK